MRLDALAQRVGGELAGDPGLEVHQVAPPEDARPGTVVVVTDPRRLALFIIEGSNAVIIERVMSETPALTDDDVDFLTATILGGIRK